MTEDFKTGERLYLPPATIEAAKEVGRSLSGSGFAWMFLGENMDLRQELETALSGAGEYFSAGDDLRVVSQNLRDAYIDYIGSLAPVDPQSPWWTGVLSEKNPYISKTFINLCFAEIVSRRERWAVEHGRPVAIFIENNTLRLLLHERRGAAPKGTAAGEAASIDSRGTASMKRRLSMAKHLLSRREAAARAFPRKHSLSNLSDPLTLLFTFIFPADFGSDGKLANHHLGNLGEFLARNGETVAMWPYVLNDAQAEKQWQKLAACGSAILPAETFISKRDILRHCASIDAALQNDARRIFPPFRGEDITALLRMDIAAQSHDPRYTRAGYMFQAMSKWKEAGIKIAKIIYPFENHFWERHLCAAAAKYYPDAALIGSQHAQLPKMLLNYFISGAEAGSMPLPDRIATIGRSASEALKSSGYPTKMICEGAGLRFQDILDKAGKTSSVDNKQHGRATVLVASSVERSASIELLDACIKTFAATPDIDVVVKCHPVSRFEDIFPGGRPLPPNIKLSDKSIDSLLDNADAFIYSATSACLEAALRNIPIIHFVTQSMLNIDALEDAPQFKTDAATPEQIGAAIKSYMDGTLKIGGTPEERRAFIDNYANPVTDKTLAPYLGGK